MATFISNSAAETIAFAREWAESLVPNDVVALVGDLGAGKTHFVKGLVQGLASTDEATSPTFTLLHEYRKGRLPVFHFDFYRIESPQEARDIGTEEYFYSGSFCFVEWPEKILNLLPPSTVAVTIRVENGIRHIAVSHE